MAADSKRITKPAVRRRGRRKNPDEAYRMLLVDDEPSVQTLIEKMMSNFARIRCRLDCVHSLKEAQSALQKTSYDAGLIDVRLPDGNGLDLITYAREQHLDAAMIVLTGVEGEEVNREAMHRGAADFLEKTSLSAPLLERSILYAVKSKRTELRLRDAVRHLHVRERSLRQSQQALEHTQLQLIQAEKLQTVGRMAAGIAHELKNPLATLLMGLKSIEMRRKNNRDALVGAAVEEMRAAVQRADAIVKGLLDFSAPVKLQREKAQVHDVLDAALELARHELQCNHIHLVRVYHRELPTLPVDRNKLMQVFVNLVQNAVHASSEGGTLTVRTEVDKSGKRVEMIHVLVDDHGKGIPADRLERVFDPFYTTKSAGTGTGLGLSVARSIVELHGGRLTLSNRLEGGVTAEVQLPIMQDGEQYNGSGS